MAIERILVPLDGSDLAEAALETALELVCEQPAAHLVLLRAAEAPTRAAGDRMDERARLVREAETYLNGVAAGLRESGISRVKTCVWYGPAAPTIVEAAESEQASLIVMTSHGCGGLGRMIFGSVVESVLRGTRTPILVVRDIGAPISPPLGAATVGSTRDASAA
jgi:nucleotide-binding universal stress UspA family protein